MKVYIVGSMGGCQYAQMYREANWTIVDDIHNADLVQFTGGEDVTPQLYGELNHPKTYNSIVRDEYEESVYHKAIELGLPMVGICRGGQFLNVMNGGKMYQHVDNHGVHGTHEARDVASGKKVQVTSTHHQMMRPAENAIIICDATLASKKEYMMDDVVVDDCQYLHSNDIESVFYPDTKCLCFQPHPEFNRLHIGDTREYFFELLMCYIGV